MERLDDLLPQADIVVLVVPHSPQTAGLMNEDRLRRMKEGAILISSGRGSVLDQAALARVMGEGRLWGAALDVTTPEPLPQDSPLWDIPDLLITPHCGRGDAAGDHPPHLRRDGPGQPKALSGGRTPGKSGGGLNKTRSGTWNQVPERVLFVCFNFLRR